jgi:heat shock protein HslJ
VPARRLPCAAWKRAVVPAFGASISTASCNRVTGSFEVDGDKLRLRGMAGTMMACPTGIEQEQRFLRSFDKVERYRIRGSHLEMLDAAGAVIARFEAVALR